MMEMKISSAKLADFVDYVLDFYGPDSELYPELAFTREEVLFAVAERFIRFYGGIQFRVDSYNREQVRDVILEIREAA
tara:strand:+ start:860 stop:1093 length:234 start_codon:yes stop_codon:yes gene_type:complete